MREYAPIILADLRREYGIDLLDFWRGRLSFYELCAYLSGLPPECPTARRLSGLAEAGDGWSTEALLLGGILDATRNAWAEKPVDSCLPKVLIEESKRESKAKPELQPASELAGLFTSPEKFISSRGG